MVSGYNCFLELFGDQYEELYLASKKAIYKRWSGRTQFLNAIQVGRRMLDTGLPLLYIISIVFPWAGPSLQLLSALPRAASRIIYGEAATDGPVTDCSTLMETYS